MSFYPQKIPTPYGSASQGKWMALKVSVLSAFLVFISPTIGVAGEYGGGDQAVEDEESSESLTREPADESVEEDEDKAPEEIVVTGTLIKRSNITTPTPTTVLDTEAIMQSGQLNMVEMINELPSVYTGYSSQTTTYSFFNAGLNQVDLRDLGVRRTLVLVDGRRPVGTPDDSNFLAFDIGSLPSQLIERVEVITGGASAVYGSDAVAGVVNIITKKDFEGAELNFQAGISEKADGEETSANILVGRNFFNDRGNAVVSFNFYEFKGVWKRDRDFSNLQTRYVSNPEDTGPNDGIPDFIAKENLRRFLRFNKATVMKLPVNAQLERDDSQSRYVTFDENGNLKLFEFGPSGNLDDAYTDGGDAGLPSEDQRLLVPWRRINFTTRYRHDFTDYLRLNLEGRYALTEARDTIDSGFAMIWSVRDVIDINNPYIKDDLKAVLVGDPADPADDIGSFTFWRHHREYGPRTHEIERQFFSASAGLEGDIGENWSWQVYYQAGGTSTAVLKLHDQLDANFIQAIDAVRDPDTGEIVCRDQSNGCVPANVLGPTGSMSQEAVDFILADHNTRTRTQQQIFTAYVTGNSEDFFSLPAGPVGLAAGTELREEKLNFLPSNVWRKAEGFYASEFQPINASVNVKEVFAEALVPLLKDLPAVDSLNFETAIRYANYNFGGSNLSWKVGGDWSPIKDVRFRTIYAQAVRAPGLSELFTPGGRGASSLSDPCDELFINDHPNRAANCRALGIPENFVSISRTMSTLVYYSGNDELEAEKGRTWTVGGVITPRYLPDFALAVDFWDIVLSKGIASFGAQTILNSCVDSPSINNKFCDLVERSADHNIYQVRDTFVNADRMEVRGIDFEANYRLDLGDLLDLPEESGLRFRLVVSHLMKWDYYTNPGSFVDEKDALDEEAGEIGNPKWRGMLNVTFDYSTFSFNWQTRYVGPQDYDVDPEVNHEIRDPFTASSTFYSDVNLRYTFMDFPLVDQQLEVYAGVNNIFNTALPKHPSILHAAYVGFYSFYSPIGRYLYGGVTVRF